MDLPSTINIFRAKLARREITGSYAVAKHTAELFRIVVSSVRKGHTVESMITQLRSVARELQDAAPMEIVIGNIARRVLYFIREECEFEDHLLDKKASDIKAAVIEQINEFLFELSSLHDELGKHGPDFIVDGDVVLTYGDSMSCESLLMGAKEKGRSFHVYTTSASLASKLKAHLIPTTVVTPACIFPIMPRINKCIVGAHVVMANGGVLALQGAHTAALAAKHHAVPFVVCTAMYKLCPLYTVDQETYNELENPASTHGIGSMGEGVMVSDPRCDYVPPGLVTLFVTNQECISPSYIYRLLTEFYYPADTVL
jgi:translation initiation factor eIF-2B subunit beta